LLVLKIARRDGNGSLDHALMLVDVPFQSIESFDDFGRQRVFAGSRRVDLMLDPDDGEFSVHLGANLIHGITFKRVQTFEKPE
jgi:hypothetical protein